MSEFESITTSLIDDVTVVSFNDHKVMDPARIQVLGEELLSLVNPENPPRILINLNNVRFLSSAAINKLIVIDKRLKSVGGSLKICAVSSEVSEVFAITHLDSVFEICDSQRDALESFAN